MRTLIIFASSISLLFISTIGLAKTGLYQGAFDKGQGSVTIHINSCFFKTKQCVVDTTINDKGCLYHHQLPSIINHSFGPNYAVFSLPYNRQPVINGTIDFTIDPNQPGVYMDWPKLVESKDGHACTIKKIDSTHMVTLHPSDI